MIFVLDTREDDNSWQAMFGEIPRDLDDLVVLAKRRAKAGVFQGPTPSIEVSETLLESMIRVCFAASLIPEEGRYPKFQLHAAAGDQPPPFAGLLVKFVEPVSIADPRSLAKLATASPSEGTLILVSERNGGLVALGLVSLKKSHYVRPPGSEFVWMPAALKGATAEARGPGYVAVYGRHPPIELRGGRILSPVIRCADYEMVKLFFKDIISRLFGSRGKWVESFPDTSDRSTNVRYFVTSVWQLLIEKMRAHKHGAAIIITSAPQSQDISIKYPLENADFGQRLVSHFDSSFQTELSIDREMYFRWRQSEHDLLATINLISGASKIDGCVILDSSLKVLGFGCKLGASQNLDGEVEFIDPLTSSPSPNLESEINRFGTRHSSAFRFCCAHDETIAFVVSQDGDLRIFLRRGQQVGMIDSTSLNSWTEWDAEWLDRLILPGAPLSGSGDLPK